ncbi:MAG: single-stranded-DNA-specific exonuclease RecJ [Ruminococcus sp.]|nr:single-stranded-DNA-specific exonuclease RecJ [Ruminococcus sp.]
MKQWSIAKLNKDNAAAISEKYDLPPIVSILLDIRGISTERDIESFLYNESEIENPLALKDMDKAVERIKRAIDNGEKICVYGDFDADGVTSTALLYSYLEAVGADVMYYIPSRETEGYGMHNSAIDKFNADNVNLIVTVDNGISAVEQITYSNSLGIDTVVTDHHMPGETLPDACAVVDMHRSDCKSEFKTISGVGVAFKLVCALEGEYADIDMLLDNYSDLVCIGTIGDIMPLIKDNRVFVKRGLININNSDRPGVASLVKVSGLADKDISVSNVSFGLVPRINAAGRLGASNDSVSLLLSDDFGESESIASKLGENNSDRQHIEKEIIDSINKLIYGDPSMIKDRIIVIDGYDWHQGVIGIVSARIKDYFGKPCIIITRGEDICRGSGRSIEGFDLWEAVSSCSELLKHYGGHPMAVGLSLTEDKIDAFRKAINDFARNAGEMPFDKLKIDAKINSDIIDADFAADIKQLAPFGAGNPVPVFQLSNLRITGITPLSGNKHIRFTLAGAKKQFSALWFFKTPAENPYRIGDIVDAAVNLEVSLYKNTESLSVIIKDIKFSGVDYSEYIRSQRVYESFLCGESIDRDTLRTIIPTRGEFASIYRYLRDNVKSGGLRLDVLVYRMNSTVTYGKLKVALETMKELGLVEYNENMKGSFIRLLNVQNKVKLEDAPTIIKLKEVYRRG